MRATCMRLVALSCVLSMWTGAVHAQGADDAAASAPAQSPAAATAPALPTSSSAQAAVDPTEEPQLPEPRALTEQMVIADAEADALLEDCRAAEGAADAQRLSACLLDVEARAPRTPAAERARGMRQLLSWRAAREVQQAQGLFAPGRLEIASGLGVFGVWNAVAAGILAARNLPELDPGFVLMGASGLALAAGVGGGIGGLALADALHLSEGGARLATSGLVWGTNVGVPLGLWMASAIQSVPYPTTDPQTGLPDPDEEARYWEDEGERERARTNIVLLTTLASGYAVGGTALWLASELELDAADVSLINSGGILGSMLGVLGIANLTGVANVSDQGALAATYIAGNLVGLAGGGLLANWLDLTWGQTLMGDLGAVVGGITFGLGTAGALMLAGGNNEDLGIMLITGAVAAGAVGGYATGLVVSTRVLPQGAPAPLALTIGPPLHIAAPVGGAVWSSPSLQLAF